MGSNRLLLGASPPKSSACSLNRTRLFDLLLESRSDDIINDDHPRPAPVRRGQGLVRSYVATASTASYSAPCAALLSIPNTHGIESDTRAIYAPCLPNHSHTAPVQPQSAFCDPLQACNGRTEISSCARRADCARRRQHRRGAGCGRRPLEDRTPRRCKRCAGSVIKP